VLAQHDRGQCQAEKAYDGKSECRRKGEGLERNLPHFVFIMNHFQFFKEGVYV